jgi:hypothetical protein
MATEKLEFKLELYATMHDHPPIAEILINGQSCFKKDITGTMEKPDVIQFYYDLEEGQKYDLIIKRSNKTRRSTVVNEKGDVLKDQLLHIKCIEIDEINIGGLVYTGEYTPTYPEPWATQQRRAGVELPESFKNVTTMGHNGQWKLSFESPFYMWLLENLY